MILPEKNCAISSLEQPNGSPRSLTTASLMLWIWSDPARLITHSISLFLDRNTDRERKI